MFAVLLRDSKGKLLGRLTRDDEGYPSTTTRNIRALMFSEEAARDIAEEINSEWEGFSAKVIPF